MTAVHNPTMDEKFLGPPGSQGQQHPDIDFGAMTPTTNGSAASLPTYDDAANHTAGSSSSSAFQPTRHLQIQAEGFSCVSLTGHSKDPAFIYEVSPDGQHGTEAYLSLRPGRISNDCTLVRANDNSQTPLCSTTYRVGPFRPPRLSLPGWNDEVTVSGSNWNCLSRKTMMNTPVGEFRWRYGGRKERKAEDATNLLILEISEGSDKDSWRKVGQLVRSKALRSEGTSRWSSGNGGRLMLDLRPWSDAKGVAQQLEVLAVSSCLVMLKKEVDNAVAAVSTPAPVVVVS